jgi:uncharacterized protein (TIGR03382 family)
MDLSALALLATVGAGYGVPVDGFPSHAERVLLLWTNAARVDPEAFDQEYQAGYEPCSFDDFLADEQVPKAPMYIDIGLTEAARYHSETMEENACFQHDSCDGSGEDFGTRVSHYYSDSGYVGENIAMGTTDPRYAVMGMWMCSSGHRANIMTGDYNEMGPGISGTYLTQDFAAGTLAEGDPPVRVATDDGDTWYADWGAQSGPREIAVVINGVDTTMSLTWGEPEQGVYSATPVVEADTCSEWYVWWETEDGEIGTFPEEGSLLVGTGCDGDWVEHQFKKGGLFGDVPEDELGRRMLDDVRLIGGCSSAPGGVGLLAVGLATAALAGRRRR